MPRNSIEYDEDFYAWTVEQSRLLRAGEFAAIDAANIAEDIESMGRSDRRELKSRLVVLVMHLLKWQHQPRGRSRSWSATIDEQRLQIDGLLAESPSLRPNAAAMLGRTHQSPGQARPPKPDWPMRPFRRRVPSSRTRCCHARFFPKAE